jgi:hypothetical protein
LVKLVRREKRFVTDEDLVVEQYHEGSKTSLVQTCGLMPGDPYLVFMPLSEAKRNLEDHPIVEKIGSSHNSALVPGTILDNLKGDSAMLV